MKDTIKTAKKPWKLTTFFVLTFILSLPAYVGATFIPQEMVMFMGLLLGFAPITAALILAYRVGRLGGATGLLKRSFDYKNITRKIWYIPIVFLMPTIFIIVLGIMRLVWQSIPDPILPIVAAPIALLGFFFFAVLEEVGWMGYAVDLMLARWNALNASLLLGLIWAIWHLPLYIAAGLQPFWIAGQLMGLIALRTLIVWLYNNIGGSVFGTIVFHAVYNVCALLLPSFYTAAGHLMTSIFIIMTASIVVYLWDAETLAQYRFHSIENTQ